MPRFDALALRNALGRFATGVAIVTARDADGLPVGMTMSSFNAVSLDPALVLFSVDRRAHSLAALSAADGYGINILGASQEALSGRFARAFADKWHGVAHVPGYAGAPLLEGALAHLECRPYAQHDGGDHVIFVVEVVSFATSVSERQPLVFFGGRYHRLAMDAAPADDAWPLPLHYF
jgi:flavin reductase (DIM6/NTAB) family NADH-FMN oxidoreductase RutF